MGVEGRAKDNKEPTQSTYTGGERYVRMEEGEVQGKRERLRNDLSPALLPLTPSPI